jgi:hypothetical protein
MRASARPPWRTLLLALLLAAGCTTAPASRESAAGTTTAPAVRQPAAGSTLATLAPVKLSGVVRLEPGLSGGLVTVVGLTGQSRPEPGGGRTQLAVKVTGEDWVGKLPTRVWVPGPLDPGGTSCQDCANYFGFQEKGSLWVVTVRDADAKLIDALLVVRGKVRIPPAGSGQLPIADDVDGGDPSVVDVDALKARAGRR